MDGGRRGESGYPKGSRCQGQYFLKPPCYAMVRQGAMEKGDVLGVARVAGIMAAKKAWELIPLCHVLNLTKLALDFEMKEENHEIQAVCTARVTGKTGVEMEALTGVSVALLTVYDMCKAVDKSMEIGSIYLEKKTGGESGGFVNPKSRSVDR